MNRSKLSSARKCCSIEKERLVKSLQSCNRHAAGTGIRHQCYREAAKESGRRAKSCLL